MLVFGAAAAAAAGATGGTFGMDGSRGPLLVGRGVDELAALVKSPAKVDAGGFFVGAGVGFRVAVGKGKEGGAVLRGGRGVAVGRGVGRGISVALVVLGRDVFRFDATGVTRPGRALVLIRFNLC